MYNLDGCLILKQKINKIANANKEIYSVKKNNAR